MDRHWLRLSLIETHRILVMKNDALKSSKPDEYLYGRAGYLYTLMFLRHEIGSSCIDQQVITDVQIELNTMLTSFKYVSCLITRFFNV
jgi:hypothetical protein